MLMVFCTAFSLPSYSSKGPVDPAGPGNGILGFGFGPGVGWYGASGFGPAILAHYDHSIWKVGPGTISLGGQVGTSFYWYKHLTYNYSWINMGVVFRAAYHYGWKVPGLDTYAGFGAGTQFSMFDNDGDPDPGRDDFRIGFLPTGFVGASYFFTDVIGVNAEFGHNFAYASIGLNFRLGKK